MSIENIFCYCSYVDPFEDEITKIRFYGLTEHNETVCLHINDFTPYIYIELPEYIKWTNYKAQVLGNYLDELLGEKKPLRKSLIYKYKLYEAHMNDKFERKLFPFLFCSFSHKNDIYKRLIPTLRKALNVYGIGWLKLKIHESDADPILQLITCRDLPSTGWISFKSNKMANDDKLTHCKYEYELSWKDITKSNKKEIVHPLIMAFDIEVNSSNPAKMPVSSNPLDKIFQISCVFKREGDEFNHTYEYYILSLGEIDTDYLLKDADYFDNRLYVLLFDTEADLLEGFTELICDKNPNIISGYNILGFDMQYMIERAKLTYCFSKFDKMGFHLINHCVEKKIKWSSTAFKDQEFLFLDLEGRILVDLLPLIQRDYKFSNYKLKTVSEEILKDDNKKDLSIPTMFKLFKIGIQKDENGQYNKKSKKAMSIIASYCIKDSELVIKLIEKMRTWISLCEMSNVVNTSIFALYTQGQQIKIFSQVYKFCFKKNIIVQKDGYIAGENDRYMGAHVFPPVPGIYDRVLPFDFCSLYPSTIIAYNIDYFTYVTDDKIPDSMCNVMSWSEHQICDHDPKIIKKNELTAQIEEKRQELKKLREERDKKINKSNRDFYVKKIELLNAEIKPLNEERSELVKSMGNYKMCTNRKFRFLKEPKGVIPTILQNTLDARKQTRNQIKQIKQELSLIKDTDINKYNDMLLLTTVLDKRQLAYKISSNSMYGGFGVKKGYLPFMPGAMVTTYLGRKNIEIVANTICAKYEGKLVYGDSVTEDTPILCKINNKVCYRTIDNIPHLGWNIYKNDKEMALLDNIQVWTENGFTKIKKIIRHKTDKDIYRVLTHTGLVDVTEDHGLLDIFSNKISPKELIINKSKLLTHNLPKCDELCFDITVDLAFVFGLFFADGSTGIYFNKNNIKSIGWGINKQDYGLLEKCRNILNESLKNSRYEQDTLYFKIYDTINSSSVFKLEVIGKNKEKFVETWRKMFYDNNKYKKVPDEILWSSVEIRKSFFEGYYAGDGDKCIYNCRFDNKGKIGAAGLYLLANSIGYNVSINDRSDKLDIFRLTCTTKKQRKDISIVKKIRKLGKTTKYVYDLETENHHFSAGIGQLIVHNTDSNYVHFPNLKTAEESWKHAEMVAAEVTKLFPPPVKC